MGKVRAIAVLLVLLLPLGFAFCDNAQGSVRTGLVSLAQVPALPRDSRIGQLCDVQGSEVHSWLYNALRQEYSVSWLESFVHEDVRSALASLYGSWFASCLPCSSVLMSVGHVNADGSVGVNVRIGQSCMAFIVLDGKIVAMRSLD